MKKIVLLLLLLFFAQSIVAQEVVEYNKCEVYPQLKNKKDFIKEISENLEAEEDLEVIFYIDITGNYYNIKTSNNSYNSKLINILNKLGEWECGKFNDKKVITIIKFKIKIINN